MTKKEVLELLEILLARSVKQFMPLTPGTLLDLKREVVRDLVKEREEDSKLVPFEEHNRLREESARITVGNKGRLMKVACPSCGCAILSGDSGFQQGYGPTYFSAWCSSEECDWKGSVA